MADLSQIKSLLKSGDVAEAETLCRKALEAMPDDAELKRLHAICRERLNPEPPPQKPRKQIGCLEIVVLLIALVAALVGLVIMYGASIRNRMSVLVGPDAMLRKPSHPITIDDVIIDHAGGDEIAPSNGGGQ